jgi:hypothetical protein
LHPHFTVLALAGAVGCASAVTDGDLPPSSTDTDSDPNPAATAATEPPTAAIGPLRLTLAQTRRAVDTLAGEPYADTLSWPTETTRRGLAGQEEVAAIGPDLVDAVADAAEVGSHIWRDRVLGATVAHIEIEDVQPAHGCPVPGVSQPGEVLWLDWGTAPIALDVSVPTSGRYLVRVRAGHRPSQAGFGGAVTALDVDGTTRWGWDLLGADDPKTVDYAVDLQAGPHQLALRLPYGLDEATEASLYVVHSYCVEGNAVGYDWIEVVGPLDVEAVPCRPVGAPPPIAGLNQPPPEPTTEACAAEALVPLAERGWRRPVSPASLDALTSVTVAALEAGDGWEDALSQAWRAIVSSPRFLARLVPGTSAPRPLDAWERAERLALTVWGDLPDAELAACAASGALARAEGPCGWTAQVQRALNDPKAAALTDDFFVGWLGLDQLDLGDLPPGAPASAFESLRTHARSALHAAQVSDAPATALLTLPLPPLDPTVSAWLGDSMPRIGWLTAPAVLASLSEPWRSSPVRRGVYVLDRLRCDAPPPPPGDIPSLVAAPGDASDDILDALAAHRADPACAACHDAIDPIGLSLEAWGPGGVSRATSPSAASALDGTALPDAAALAAWLAASEDVDRCFTARFASYALGRDVPLADPALAAWTPRTRGQPWLVRMQEVLHSDAFLSWTSASEVQP